MRCTITLFMFVAFILMTSGCYTTTLDVQTDRHQPWYDYRGRVTARHVIREGYGGYGHLTWTYPNKARLNAEPISQRAARFMIARNAYEGWTVNLRNVDSGRVFSQWKAIVSLRPVVVVVVPHDYVTRPRLGGVESASIAFGPIDPFQSQMYQGYDFETSHVQLPYGFVGSDRVPFHSEIMWFAPDLDIGPHVVQIEDGGGSFEVQGVEYRLTRDGDVLVVTLRPASLR